LTTAQSRYRRRRPWTASRIAGGIKRYGALALIDWLAVGTTYVLAIAVRTGGRPEVFDPQIAPFAIGAAFGAGILQVFSNLLFDVYWRDWSAAAIEDMVAIVKASTLVVIALLAFNLATDAHWIPTGAILAGGSLSLVVEAALHLRPRWPQIMRAALGRSPDAENLIVVGAGRLGQLLAADITQGGRDYRIACFVDDDPRKTGSYVRGVRVGGRVADLPELIDRYGSSNVVIAIADPPGGLVHRVMDLTDGKDVRVRRVSGFALLHGNTTALRPIGIEELLAREPVDLSTPGTTEHYSNKRILITGAAGSIGSELARQLLRLSPERLFLLDSNESGLHGVHESLGRSSTAEIVLGDIRDAGWLHYTLDQIRPQVVFHAAAYKHVPILERAPLPGISTNVIGTANVLDAVSALNIGRFVFVSTDKAVEPTSVLGYTKQFGELLTLARARELARDYAVVRFGNVLGSVGSAVPVFSAQIDGGGPVTVTHAEATRYFMTIEEAAGLLIVAGALAGPADLLVLDMGDPVSIVELAKRMIRLRGLRTPADIEIRYTGLRPGEKLHEELLSADERATGTPHPRIIRVESTRRSPSGETLDGAVRAIIDRVGQQDADGALDLLTAVIGVDRRLRVESASANWNQ
jgi:FlaA1/EpsC-like NDP-sugar epimerase